LPSSPVAKSFNQDLTDENKERSIKLDAMRQSKMETLAKV